MGKDQDWADLLLRNAMARSGDESPDVDDAGSIKMQLQCHSGMHDLKDLILSGHDRSDGGLATTLLEMAFAGNCGIEVDSASESRGQGASQEADSTLIFRRTRNGDRIPCQKHEGYN